jgi:hypothetical protein
MTNVELKLNGSVRFALCTLHFATVAVTLEKQPAGWTITSVQLDVLARVPGARQRDFIRAPMPMGFMPKAPESMAPAISPSTSSEAATNALKTTAPWSARSCSVTGVNAWNNHPGSIFNVETIFSLGAGNTLNNSGLLTGSGQIIGNVVSGGTIAASNSTGNLILMDPTTAGEDFACVAYVHVVRDSRGLHGCSLLRPEVQRPKQALIDDQRSGHKYHQPDKNRHQAGVAL